MATIFLDITAVFLWHVATGSRKEGEIRMDILSIASQLMGATSQDTSLLSQFLEHPYSTTQQVTGADEMLNKTDMSQVLTALAAMTGGQQKADTLDTNSIATLASTLLGKNDNSIHGLTNMLFGTSEQVQEQVSKKKTGLDLGTMMSVAGLASTLLGGSKKKSTGIDLSDGIGLDDIMALAGGALTGSTKKKSGVDLSDGIDVSDIAALAAGLLGKK